MTRKKKPKLTVDKSQGVNAMNKLQKKISSLKKKQQKNK